MRSDPALVRYKILPYDAIAKSIITLPTQKHVQVPQAGQHG
jgi:hypothetical protein